MSLERLLNQPLTLQRQTGSSTDEYGNTVLGALGLPETIYGYLEQSSSTETMIDRDTVLTRWTAHLRKDSNVGPLDVITFEGRSFQVDGAPTYHYNPRTQMVSHITASLVSFQG